MPSTRCFVPGCRSGYDKEAREKKAKGERRTTLFRAPRDQQLFEEWERRAKRGDRPLSHRDSICALHFEDKYILKYFETKMPDGSICRIERGKWGLVPGAVPTKFDFQKYFPPRGRKTRPPIAKRTRNLNEVSNEVPVSQDLEGSPEGPSHSNDSFTPSTEYGNPEGPSHSNDSFTPSTEHGNPEGRSHSNDYSMTSTDAEDAPSCLFHIEDVLNIVVDKKLPYVQLENGSVMILKITDDYAITKHVVIEMNMMTKVFIGGEVVVIDGLEKIESSAQFELFLSVIDDMRFDSISLSQC